MACVTNFYIDSATGADYYTLWHHDGERYELFCNGTVVNGEWGEAVTAALCGEILRLGGELGRARRVLIEAGIEPANTPMRTPSTYTRSKPWPNRN